MVDGIFISFAFSAGFIAFFSPCAITLLPGFITYFLSKNYKNENKRTVILLRGLLFGLFAILGFFTVFGLVGLLVILFGNFIKRFIPWIAIITGIILIFIGIFLLFGKEIMLPIHFTKKTRTENYKKESYLFGIAYAVAALGCTFPVFLTVVLQSFVSNDIIDNILPLFAYIIGMSLMMIIVTILTTLSRDFIRKRINVILPYIHMISGLILIGAGIYMIYWQWYLV